MSVDDDVDGILGGLLRRVSGHGGRLGDCGFFAGA
ncbi:hypothetical protein L284_17085 [Novosphingobium lindaniclasticum LE124]|uniref:Uncharacterized protein n=1 Tax=Novosphingobium lindaniclasticum LE124 TaxID=1096930 RepID=T0H241_9SPHN|nr:hypothetical protein L284_17085 [Novosphingobium lindaniclasticum LE124]